MSMTGCCDCNNIQILWHVVDYSLIPRACQCDYCYSRSAAYVSKSSTRVEVLIRNEGFHKRVRHGSKSAVFHECINCKQIIFVTSEIEDELYGALNANHLDNKFGFPAPVKANFSSLTAEQKRERWRKNWCHPILIKSLDSRSTTTVRD